MRLDDAREILKSRALTLRPAFCWPDRNDLELLDLHKEINKVDELLVACFTRRFERNHQWQMYVRGDCCVQINFIEEKFLQLIDDYRKRSGYEIFYDSIKYMNIENLRSSDSFSKHIIAFIKRKVYEDEKEFRIIAHAKKGVKEIKIPIDLSCIRYINVDPRASEKKFTAIKDGLKCLAGSSHIDIRRSQLNYNPDWMTEFKRFIDKTT